MPKSRTIPAGTRFFSDPRAAGKHLAALDGIFAASAGHSPGTEFRTRLLRLLRRSPDADTALAQLLRFVEAAPTPAALLNDLVQYPPLLEVLLAVFGSSRYFSDILVRDPGLFRWLTAGNVLSSPLRQEELAAEAGRALRMFRSPARSLDALKRLYRRTILRIGTKDILGEAEVETATGELSMLADAMVQAAFALAAGQLSELFPRPAPTPVAVIGLGKLGGGELNYSSDIDLMVVYGEEGEISDARGRPTGHQEYVSRLVERAVQHLTETTAEGHLYRVDLRLRPEGNAGPLARSLNAALLYYEMRGELWERQMLIKARPVAGDLAFGDAVIARLTPFVYPRTLLHSPAESIARIKARIEAAVGERDDVKLGPGGIRDIEFAVQALQLLNGGRMPSVRSNTTLRAIELLQVERLLTQAEARTLREAYVFFRTIEHRLQMDLNVQTHAIPRSMRERRSLALRVQRKTAAGFMQEYRRRTAGVRKIFDQVLSPPGSPLEAGLDAVLEGNVRSDSVRRLLTRHGFMDIRSSSRALASLLRGESLTGAGTLDLRLRELIRQHAAPLLKAVGATPSPDLTLSRLAGLADAPALREVLYRELADPGFRNILIGLCSRFPGWTRAAVAHPVQLEDVIRLRDPGGMPDIDPGKDPVGFKIAGGLRAGAGYALGQTTFEEFTAGLSSIADTVLSGVFQREGGEGRKAPPPLAVFALGKYGTLEIAPDADLDLLFVGEPRSGRAGAVLEALAAGMVAALSAVTESGRGYDVDTRLRPEGRNAPLVVEREAYLKYLHHRASLWERQSLTRLRFVCGDRRTGERVLAGVQAFVYEEPLPTSWAETIVGMRKKMETRSKVRSGRFLDIKLGAGGMADIEFVAQMLLLSAGRSGRQFHAFPTVAVLKTVPSGAVAGTQRNELSRIYQFFRRIEVLMRMILEERGSVLPEGEKLALLSRYAGSGLADRCAAEMRSVRAMFLEIASRLERF
jgi:glutamate-ammonia-ligase adenylyltransferase